MIRVAIVEDDFESQDRLREYIERYGAEFKETFEVAVFQDGEEIVQQTAGRFGIIFLDVKMERMDGLTAARRIRAVDEDVILIFITNMAQYAIKGYEVDALSYLLKPVPYFAFSQELKRSIRRLEKRATTNYLTLTTENGIARLDSAKILFVERDRHRVVFHAEKKAWSAVGTIRETELTLQGGDFFRCNSGYIVNMAHVTGVQDNFVLVGEYKLQISRPRKKVFLAALTDYYGRRK
jgi:DNA-binding LytR/AlgR family response regulator